MSQFQANILLVFVTIGWGSSYLFTKYGLAELQPINLVAYRFLIAFLVMYAIFYKRMRHVIKETIQASIILGIILCCVSSVFGYALIVTTASTAGFLIATTVVMVPMLMIILTKQAPTRQVKIGTVIVITGIALFSIHDSISFEIGMILCLFTAFLYALHIVLNNRFAQKNDGIQLGVLQLGFGGLFATICTPLFETPALPQTSQGYMAVIMLALICSAFAVVMQSWAQQYTTAEHTGFIFALEPIFAAILAYIFLHESMSQQEILGALFIFLGVVVANHTPRKKEYALAKI
ncbi:DMT family transporter [Caryophanon tenue]|uniref:EamA domain-containing protein n=1 Tax=Caryophanon tenue TaxID=33978 RepID=A0A1C0YIW5_9BACL|nr:DMT family transporter [Caryophanon tenue]OCS87110.1 hypothetical protein A6M13_11585 [Caryophanon tenue]